MGNFYELFPLKQEKIGTDDERAKTLETAGVSALSLLEGGRMFLSL
tara:strand:+ start:383 stop:520 length:138 start_codon:yes stop_codon:yes gene_type:complete